MVRRFIIIVIYTLVALAVMVSSATAVTSQSDWNTAQTPHFNIHAPKRADLQEIGMTAESIYTSMASRYGYDQAQKIELYVYTNRTAFLDGSPSEDAAGYASPSHNSIALLLGTGNSTVTLGHEINHIIFMRSVPRIDTVPEWFIEGLAIYESQPGIEVVELEKYALAKDIPDLVGQADGEGSKVETPGDYGQGYLMVGFIANSFGKDGLSSVISRLQAGEDFNTALTRAVGLNEKELNSKWRAYARKQVINIWLIQLRDIGWYLMGGAVLLVIIIAPLKKRKRLREMEDEEDNEREESGK